MDRLPDRWGDRLPEETEGNPIFGVSTPKKKKREVRAMVKALPELQALLTVEEVSDILRLSAKGVYSLVENRKIPFIRVSNRVRFLPGDVMDWVRENRVPVLEMKP